jgi:hypothetical protein
MPFFKQGLLKKNPSKSAEKFSSKVWQFFFKQSLIDPDHIFKHVHDRDEKS